MKEKKQIEKDREQAERLFGKPRGLIKATGDFQEPTKEKLLEPLGEGFFVHFFCRGCGTILELGKSAFERVCLEELNITPPDTVKEGEYLASDGCPMCDGIDGNFEFKKLD